MLEPTATRTRTRQELATLFAGMAAVVIGAIIIAALFLGRDIFIPLAMAVLLSFALAPLAGLLQRWHLPRGLAVTLAVAVAFAAMLGMGMLLAKQITDLAGELPRYERTLREKIQTLRGATDGHGTLERAADVLQGLGDELDGGGQTEGAQPEPPAGEVTPTPGGEAAVPADPDAPMVVQIQEPAPGTLQRLGNLISPLVNPLVTAFIVLVFVIFILLQREDLRNRLIRLAGAHDFPRTTAALDDAATRISRLFLLQLLVNGAFGSVIGLGLWLLGIPNALLWGFLGAMLRFLPFVGFMLAAVVPVVLAVTIDPGWSLLFWTLGLYIVAETIVSQVVEPVAYGKGTGLSPVAVVVAATFWTALWGPVGLLLSTPLTVCLVVLGRHVESLSFLDILFGDQPVLTPAQLFYQRMLAGDPMEAASEADSKMKQSSLVAYYERVAIDGLQLAQRDLARGALDRDHLLRIRETVYELATDLLWREPLAPDAKPPAELPVLAPERRVEEGQERVVCIGGRNLLDESAALLLGEVLQQHGLGTRVAGPEILAMDRLDDLVAMRPAILCLCYLDTDRPAHLRYTVRRLRRRLPEVKLLLGCWATEEAPADVRALQELSQADGVFGSLTELAEASLLAAGAAALPEAAPAVEAAAEPASA